MEPPPSSRSYAGDADSGNDAASDDELIDNAYNDADLPDPEFEKAHDLFRAIGKTPPVRAIERIQIVSPIAPRIRSISDIHGDVELDDRGAWKAIMDCVRADHRMYNICGFMHGDITNRSVCWTVEKDGAISGVLLDLDDRIPDEDTSSKEDNKSTSA